MSGVGGARVRSVSALLLFVAPVLLIADEDLRQEYANFVGTSRSAYVQFTQANERYYAESLIRDWVSFNEARSDPYPGGEKPSVQPGSRTQSGNVPPVQPRQPLAPDESSDFFGHRVAPPPVGKTFPRLASADRSQLADFRRAFVQHADFHELALYVDFLRERYTGDAWASLQLLQVVCTQLYSRRLELQGCLWVLGQSQGLDIRVARSVAGLELLIKSEQQWFDHPYFTVGGDRLQVVDKNSYKALPDPRLQIHTKAHPQASDGAAIYLSRGLKPALRQARQLAFDWGDLKLTIDPDHARYLASLPTVDISDYLADVLPGYLQRQLSEGLLPLLERRSEEARIEFLLAWLQKLPYLVDEVQFGYEKPMTLTELLYFEASDCEDRVYALAVLARHLLGVKTAALKFPGHLSAAVKLNGRWREADPTYLGGGLDDRQPAYWQLEAEWYY